MSFLYDTEEERETGKRTPASVLGRAVGTDSEIALGTRSLLGIFFGLVLICGIFFGLGYSVGRAGGSRAAAANQEMATAPTPDSHLNKPSAEQSLTPAPEPVESDQDNGGTPPAQPAPQPVAEQTTPGYTGQQPPANGAAPPMSPTPAPRAVPATPRPVAGMPAAPATPAPVPQPVTSPGTAALMVQVAAVRVPQDADILVEALRRHGYAAVIRREPQDDLLHVQLGPFATRPDAMAMRSRLLADGYNAVIK
jgi:DedD protein